MLNVGDVFQSTKYDYEYQVIWDITNHPFDDYDCCYVLNFQFRYNCDDLLYAQFTSLVNIPKHTFIKYNSGKLVNLNGKQFKVLLECLSNLHFGDSFHKHFSMLNIMCKPNI